MGSLAISLCHLAAGRVDAVCSLKPARSVDIAAGQLLVRECGLAIDLFEEPPFEAAPLDLVGRSRVVAAGTTELCRTLEAALTARLLAGWQLRFGAPRAPSWIARGLCRLGAAKARAPARQLLEAEPNATLMADPRGVRLLQQRLGGIRPRNALRLRELLQDNRT